ncbi:hypothetical protein SAMN04488128_103157 [Chitinophaga eiseniae]|uniref:DUF6965 domain-containing protein n=1 Tax=Chitinophaga eiseniae TaxID=634771 RepID=A0A1T4SN84_9BACT|nr:hypothetical protein [Chitinophaga eiseniae]SKA29689.1 hypothetical protein SAMN04488128_103157 [Chitinophaga eiseniae]
MTAQEWEEYFSGKTLPPEIKLDDATVIKDVRKCIESHIAVVRNSQNSTFAGFEQRLKRIQQHLEQQG